ncbi:citrate synthase family protein [Duganella vulcania]|uniref:citrate synthase (unknown stereospecificity) n=1 Tax=Duganella vulcania TaxID=2692166 RepID=A0A845GJN4_9BURK|nr:citrate synthase family protein [Duganella vulcania]MYM93652.1 helix-turn-helix domain-containing protein [Duganella vulcania]
MSKDFSASEAARILGVSLATLYSYVSRGMLTPSGAQADRSKRYPHDEVLRLAARKADGKRGGHKVAAAMNWGTPVLETRISGIAGGRLHYRGHDVLALADGATLEHVACLLWDDGGIDYFAAGAAHAPFAAGVVAAIDSTQSMPPLEAAMCMLPVCAQSLCARNDFVAGAALMRMLAALLLKRAPSPEPLHLQVAQAWQADAAQTEWIRAALVLLADHELNASAFTVRCVASTGAGQAATLSAGLAALSGPQHGAGSTMIRAMLETALASDNIDAWCDGRDPSVVGFSHPLYPQGDPRGACLLERMSAWPQAGAVLAIGERVATRLGMPANADFALAAMSVVCGWPPAAGEILFALARSAGWIAHAAEQIASGSMIRPRARYVGTYQVE